MQPKPFRIGAGIGITFAGYTEETDSQINRYLNALTYSLNGQIKKGSFLHSFNVLFFMGEAHVWRDIRQFHEDYRYMTFRGFGEYALGYRLWSVRGLDTFPGWLGGNLRADFHYFYDTSHNMDIPRMTALFSLGVHATQKWLIDSRQTLSLAAGIPLLTYAVRPPFAGADERWQKYAAENNLRRLLRLGKFAGIHNYWAIHGNLNYHYVFTPLISLYSALGFEFSHINIPKGRPRRDAVFTLGAGFTFTF